MEYLTQSSIETKKLGEKLAKKVLSFNRLRIKNSAFILGLVGELGGGKTTFLQGFAKGLGIKEKILSPTFVIMKRFSIPIRVNSCSYSCQFAYFHHIDCYRIENPKEILDLGFKEIISNPKNIVAVEWAEKIRTLLSARTLNAPHLKKILPKNTLIIKFEFISGTGRESWRKIVQTPTLNT